MALKLPPEGVIDLPWHIVGDKLIILTPQGTLQFDIGVFGNKKITSVKLHLGGVSRIVVSWDGPPVPPKLIPSYPTEQKVFPYYSVCVPSLGPRTEGKGSPGDAWCWRPILRISHEAHWRSHDALTTYPAGHRHL